MTMRQDAYSAASILTSSFLEEQPDLNETPERFAKAFEYWTSGYRKDPSEILKVFYTLNTNGMIVQGSIPFYSLCEHHLTPFFGIVHFGYIPMQVVNLGSRIVGLSKISRLVEVFTRRLTIQERITNQIVDAFTDNVKPQGCGCVIRARHLCVESRGIEKGGTNTTTSALRGIFFDNSDVRREFFSFVATADAGARPI